MVRLWALSLLLILSACHEIGAAPWRAQYLSQGVGRLSQDDVTMKMGTPTSTRRLDRGGEVWVYRIEDTNTSYQYVPSTSYNWQTGAYSTGGSTVPVASRSCVEYLIRFDERKLVQEWNRREGC